jgi:general secretion pathway protein J
MSAAHATQRGFTLIELLSALLILSLVAVMSFRGLGAVLEARDRVAQETEKWKRVAAFFARFQRDVQLSAPLPLRAVAAHFEFSRFAAAEGVDAPRRVAYRLNDSREIELALFPALEGPADQAPVRYVVLSAVERFELHYLDGALAWLDAWPASEREPLPRAVRVHLVLASGEDVVRLFALK